MTGNRIGHAGAAWHASPNCGVRRGGARPDMVVLHYTAMTTAAAARDRLCDPDSEVSAHYLIDPGGHVDQLVDEALRAWHAGAGRWGGVSDVNSRSIGIELANDGRSPFPAAQIDALCALLPGILARWRIPPCRVIGHSCMAPGRKADPGARFDWQRLARAGLAVWPAGSRPSSVPCSPSPEAARDQDRFRALARQAGFTADADDAALLAAVRLRFRPWASGPLSAGDIATLADIAACFPVDRDAAGP